MAYAPVLRRDQNQRRIPNTNQNPNPDPLGSVCRQSSNRRRWRHIEVQRVNWAHVRTVHFRDNKYVYPTHFFAFGQLSSPGNGLACGGRWKSLLSWVSRSHSRLVDNQLGGLPSVRTGKGLATPGPRAGASSWQVAKG